MNAIFYSRIERRDFGDLYSARRIAHPYHFVDDSVGLLNNLPRRGELLVIWRDDPQRTLLSAPQMFVCEDGQEMDWAAWITTYAARVRPFSAHSRLVTSRMLEWMLVSRRTPDVDMLATGAVGLVLGEVIATGKFFSDRSIGELPSVAFSSTLSFAMLRAAILYSNFDDWDDLRAGWDFLRASTGQRARPVSSESIATVCSTFITAMRRLAGRNFYDAGNELTKACDELVAAAGPPQFFLSFPRFSHAYFQMNGSRENRVQALTSFLHTVDELPIEPQMVAFMLGYLTSRVAPGSMQHAAILAPALDRFPTAPLWYGLSAAMEAIVYSAESSKREVGAELPPVARRISRDLLREEPFLAQPTCDIGITELAALAQTGNPFREITTTTASAAYVELLPGINSIVNVAQKTAAESALPMPQYSLLISQLGETIERLRRMQNELKRPDDGEAQLSLLPDKRKKK